MRAKATSKMVTRLSSLTAVLPAVAVCLCFSLGSFGRATAQDEIGFVEDFTLASDREASLKQLVPGTEAYYYYHSLHYQNTEQFDKVETMMKPWVKRFGTTGLVRQIKNRQALLTYETSAAKTLEHLKRELGLRFDHQRAIPAAERDLPTRLNPSLISYDTLAKRALRTYRNTDGFEDSGLERLAGSQMNDTQLRHLLTRLNHADIEGLPILINRDLNNRDAKAFGSFSVHRLLTLDQLNELLVLRPRLLNESAFVFIYLSKLAPNNDVDLTTNDDELKAYLERMSQFVERLGPVHNSLKANILYRQLDLDLRQGKYNKKQFETYLELPRQVFYINPEVLKRTPTKSHIVNLNADYRQQTRMLPIFNDEPLVRKFLMHFLKDESDYKDYLSLVRDEYLKKVFAEVKIVNGLGDSEQWASLLSPAEFKNLMKRIDLDFEPTNPRYFKTDQPVELKLHTKNVKNLIVKVFEINTDNYYRKFYREIDTDINLDGLVPNWETTYEYDDEPLLRVARTFDFDQIDKRGVYVIDFIGNGMSSRALIRKGDLQYLTKTTLAGQSFTVLDESGTTVRDASIWMAGKRYEAGENGDVVVPFSTQPGNQSIIVSHDGFHKLGSFNHVAENYSLIAGIYVDRETLLRSGKSKAIIRPKLSVAGTQVPLSLLKDIKIRINAVDLDGIASSQQTSEIKFTEAGESYYEFQVPGRLRSITFTLTAKVDVVSQSTEQLLSAIQTLSINNIDTTASVQDVHLVKTDSGHQLEVRGKTGETRTSQAVLLKLKHRMFKRPVDVTLQTNADGRIELGTLPEITSLSATLTGTQIKTWPIYADRNTQYSYYNAKAGDVIEIPVAGPNAKASRTNYSLLERRGNTFTKDHFAAIERKPGLIVLKGLDVGDYELRLKQSNRRIQIRVTEGKKVGQYAVGNSRNLEIRGSNPLHLVDVKTNDDTVKIQLGGDTDLARVHIFASRNKPWFDAYSVLSRVRDVEPYLVQHRPSRSTYVAGRNIGDEYRYILDRKYAKKFAGNMLTRPSLLLNPWAIRETQNKVQAAAPGVDFQADGEDSRFKQVRPPSESQAAGHPDDFANLDFLGIGTEILLNLKPDENGVVTIDRKLLGEKHDVNIVVCDAYSVASRRLVLPESKLLIRDMRLANGMNPEEHFAQRKEYSVIKKDTEFELNDLLTSKFQHYDDIGDVYRFYMTLTKNNTLAEFAFVLDWPNKSDDEKRELYSKYACHELNYFLLHKDTEFFEEVVAPYLKNKRDMTFMDHWLIESDTTPFTDPWRFNRLNVAERIMLGQSLNDQKPMVLRHMLDAYQMTPTKRRDFDRLYNFAVLGDALSLNSESATRAGLGTRHREEELDNLSRFAKPGRGQGPPAKKPKAKNENSVILGADMDEAKKVADGKHLQGFIKNKESSLKRNSLALRLGRADESEPKAGAKLGKIMAGEKREISQAELAAAEKKLFADAGRGVQDLRERRKQLYRRIKPTQEWVENNYYRLPLDQQNADLVKINRFWRDYAAHKPNEEFLSPYFAEASRNFTEMMLALAVLDLPFEAPEHEFKYADNEMNLKPASNMIAFYQEVKPAVYERRGSTVLVSENFFRNDDRYRMEGDKRYDKFVTEEFLAHILYGGQVVITNPTSTPQAIDLLIQIPNGSMAAQSSQETRTVQMDLAAFSTQTLEYYFYFPKAGQYTHYPAHVSIEHRVVAVAEGLNFNVVEEPTTIDQSSWAFISQNGTEDQVLEYLRTENLMPIDLSKVAFRMGDKAFFDKVVKILADRFQYNNTLWSYSVKHNDKGRITEFLRHADNFVAACGAYLASDLITIDPVERRWYEHREYSPLVNARTHKLGPKRKILNKRIWSQYHQLLSALSCRNKLTDDDHLAVTYYLLLQDRVGEAIDHFEKVEKSKLACQLQYDYCSSYIDMYREQIDSADKTAMAYNDFPVKRWRDLFATVRAHIKEIRGSETSVVDEKNQSETQTKLADSAPSFDFKVEDRKIIVNYQNLKEVNVNFYQMDVELLFSRNPFVQQQTDGFSMIRPNQTQTVSLPADKPQHTFDLPAELKNSNVLVEISSQDQTKSKAYYAHSLAIQVIENYGQIRVTGEVSQKPVSKVYVKVYAKKKNGTVEFYKDGYTDLRGRFDYSTLSNQPLDDVSRFAILILSDDQGAVVREAGVPKE